MANLSGGMAKEERPRNLADTAYEQIKGDLFEFRLLPGDRFTEADVVERTGASRTPVRQALYRLEREGFLKVHFRNGWQVCDLDFTQLDQNYELRILLEQASVRRLEQLSPESLDAVLLPLEAIWLVKLAARSKDTQEVWAWDEGFHDALVAAAGNLEIARVHKDVTERVRIVRRLDFTHASRIAATYEEHGAILKALRHRRGEEAARLLEAHITVSRIEVRNITLHRLQSARSKV